MGLICWILGHKDSICERPKPQTPGMLLSPGSNQGPQYVLSVTEYHDFIIHSEAHKRSATLKFCKRCGPHWKEVPTITLTPDRLEKIDPQVEIKKILETKSDFVMTLIRMAILSDHEKRVVAAMLEEELNGRRS